MLKSSSDYHGVFMGEAINEAKKALQWGEVPVGAVVVWNDRIIGRGHNMKENSHDPTAHAEVLAIRDASRRLSNWRLSDTTLYVNLEPCPMCMGAIMQARIDRVVFACFDPKAGACGSLYDFSRDGRFNHSVEVVAGIKREESIHLLRGFFNTLRANKDTPLV